MYQSLFRNKPLTSKKALELQNICTNELRLPLYPVSQENSQKIDKSLKDTLKSLKNLLFKLEIEEKK